MRKAPHAQAKLAADLLTPRETAEILGIRHETLCRWRMRDQGPPFIKAGQRFIRYRRSAVEAWLAGEAA